MICPKCGVTFEDPSFFRCPRCGWQHPDPLSQREGLPWEHRREIGRIIALWETTKLLLLSPTTAMRMMRNDRARDAVFYFWAMAIIALPANSLVLSRASRAAYGLFGIFVLAYMIAGLVLIALIGMLGGFSLRIATLSEPRMSFRAVTTLYSYTAGSILLPASVPYLGWIVAFAYCNALLFIGLKNMCETSRNRTVGILVSLYCTFLVMMVFAGYFLFVILAGLLALFLV